MPSDAELMRIAIGDLKYNSSLSLEDRHRALHELLILVEPIHNANGTTYHPRLRLMLFFLMDAQCIRIRLK